MAYRMQGTYFENCNCDVLCPCGASAFALPADNERCYVLLVFHVDSGDVDGVDVGGLSVGMLVDSPGQMSDGGWRVGLFVDEKAAEEQAEKLQAVFSGELGGPGAAFTPLVGELLGVERAPIEYRDDGARHRVKIGDGVDIEIEDFVPEQTGEPIRLTGVPHPANSTLTVAQAKRARIRGFGLDVSNDGKNGHAAPFSWSA